MPRVTFPECEQTLMKPIIFLILLLIAVHGSELFSIIVLIYREEKKL